MDSAQTLMEIRWEDVEDGFDKEPDTKIRLYQSEERPQDIQLCVFRQSVHPHAIAWANLSFEQCNALADALVRAADRATRSVPSDAEVKRAEAVLRAAEEARRSARNEQS